MKKTLCLAVVLALAGCIGRSGPVEEYLRVSAGGDGCAGEAGEGKRVPVGIRRLEVAQALDRQSVMLAEGRVMSPSLRWYWEAAPGSLVEQALAGALNCSTTLAAVRPVRSTSDTALVVSGTLTDFQVQEHGKTMEVSIELQAWSPGGKSVVGTRRLSASAHLAALDGPAIAEAGAQALRTVTAQAVAWLEGLAAKEK